MSALTLKRDLATIELSSGRLYFLPETEGRRTMAVFAGEGRFTFSPKLPGEADFLVKTTGSAEFQETFDEAFLAFTDDTYKELAQGEAGGAEGGAPILERFRRRLRTNREAPRSFLEAMLSGEDSDNVEAEILADLYDPSGRGMFNLYMSGRKKKDLRFLIRPRGALPTFTSSEEVALVHLDPGGTEEAVLYLAHSDGAAPASIMDRAAFDADRYVVESTIDGKRLTGVTTIEMTALREGTRVARLMLLPDLRVSKVTAGEGGAPIEFIQEDKRDDAAFYVILPEPVRRGAKVALRIEYKGDKVVRDEGGGNFAVGARTSWYPNLNAFQDRAKFDLTFHTQPKLVLVSVGKLTEDKVENKLRRTRWVSDVPLKVAGFNLRRYKAQEITDTSIGNYLIQGFASSEPPSYLTDAPSLPGEGEAGRLQNNIAPSALIRRVMGEAQASMQIFTRYFGAAPYGRIALTQQPEFSFGQSWPGLVYMPVSAFMDATQRWNLLGSDAFRFSEFVQEVTAHEVAHQWWGHVLGWASYRDQWLSEGFADFSASLYLQATRKSPGEYHKYIDRWREALLEKNRFGVRANDLGPVSMGLRLNIPRVPGAYSRVVYSKGGYVLHMLRMMMTDPKEGDKPFMAMMRDFVATHNDRPASTADFHSVAEKHFPRQKNPDPEGKLDWFFNQWVHGSEIPSYRMEYSLVPGDGRVTAKVRTTQSGVSDGFRMPVGLYATIGDRTVKLGMATMRGNTTTEEYSIPLPAETKELMLNYNRDVLAEKVEAIRK